MTLTYRLEQTACAVLLAAAGLHTAARIVRHHAAGAVIAVCDAGSAWVLRRVEKALAGIEPGA